MVFPWFFPNIFEVGDGCFRCWDFAPPIQLQWILQCQQGHHGHFSHGSQASPVLASLAMAWWWNPLRQLGRFPRKPWFFFDPNGPFLCSLLGAYGMAVVQVVYKWATPLTYGYHLVIEHSYGKSPFLIRKPSMIFLTGHFLWLC